MLLLLEAGLGTVHGLLRGLLCFVLAQFVDQGAESKQTTLLQGLLAVLILLLLLLLLDFGAQILHSLHDRVRWGWQVGQ